MEQQARKPLYVAAYDVEADPDVSLPAVKALAEVHRRREAPATFFIVTRLLEAAGPDFKALLDDDLFDIESHTHTHANLKRTVGEALRNEIELPIRLIRETFGREVIGLTAPGGHTDGLSGRPEVLGLLEDAGVRFVRSDARGPAETVPAPFTQPYWHGEDGCPELLEIPPQFWHDNILKGYTPGPVMWPPIHPWGMPPVPPATPEEEFAVWRLGADYVLATGGRVYLPTMHPWSIYRLSSDARTIDMLLDYVRGEGMEIVSCREVYERATSGREVFPERKPETPPPGPCDWPRPSLLAEANHDLRTPLHPIVGFAEMLADGVLGPLKERQQAAAEEILNCAERLVYTYEQLVNAEKLAARRMAAELDVVSVEAVGRQVRAQAEDLSGGRAEVHVAIGPGAEAVLADEERLLDITAALLRNAIAFHPGDPHIALTAHRLDDRVLIELADDGPGIPQEVGTRAFRPLVRERPTAVSLAQGVGLGVTIASSLARLMGGDLRLKPSPGAGAAFVIELIAADPPAEK